MKKPPLSMAETAEKLRGEKAHHLICCEMDSLDILEALLQHGFYFVPVKEGHWEIFDTQNPSMKSELHTSSYLEKGQCYVIEDSKLVFSNDLSLNSLKPMLWIPIGYGFK
jgi:hypothetical protein